MQKKQNDKQGISLHIGLDTLDPDHYGGWDGQLLCAENDANDMEQIAKIQGFSTQLLLSNHATRDKVSDRIIEASKVLKSGDFFLLTYSGHGGQVPDFNRDEADNKDETWCLYDCQLIDDEVKVLWSKFAAGVRILVISDSCHSGSIIKGPKKSIQKYTDDSVKFMPDTIIQSTYIRNKDFYDSISLKKKSKAKVKASVRLLSGCQDNQYSYEGIVNGQFTAALKMVWNGGGYKKNYNHFHKEIQAMLPAYQSPRHAIIGPPNPEYDDQRPFVI